MNAQQLQRALDQLKGWREYAFLLALAERHFPDFALFAQVIGSPYATRLRGALDNGWQMLEVKDHKIDAFQLLTRIEQIRPDPERYDMFGVYPAITACELFEQALLSRCNPGKPRAGEAARLSFDSIVRFVEVSEGEGLDDDALVKLFDHHPLVRAEKAWQNTLLQMLRRQGVPDVPFVHELRRLAENEGVSSIGISLGEG
ncbi:MAG: YjaG family protein [Gammaproteobacteria bacterium]|nr:YjaG family protein [Gammaproteobacteria bacterium]